MRPNPQHLHALVMSCKNLCQTRLLSTLHHKILFAYEYLLRLLQGSRTGIVGGLISRLRVPSRRSDTGDRGMGGPTVGGAHTGR
jgi:hypothetical protein